VRVKLKVNFFEGRLVFTGPSTGRRYEYLQEVDGNYTFVEQADVPGLTGITRKQGCGCGSNGGVSEVKLFEEIIV